MKKIILFVLATGLTLSCSKDDDSVQPQSSTQSQEKFSFKLDGEQKTFENVRVGHEYTEGNKFLHDFSATEKGKPNNKIVFTVASALNGSTHDMRELKYFENNVLTIANSHPYNVITTHTSHLTIGTFGSSDNEMNNNHVITNGVINCYY